VAFAPRHGRAPTRSGDTTGERSARQSADAAVDSSPDTTVSGSDPADVIVVGLGAMGSAVTFQLARRGLRVIGVDRFRPPHDRGSTHGETRITRLAVGEGAEYVPLVRRSHELWRELEAATGSSVLEQIGGLVIGRRDNGFLEQTRAVARVHGIPHRSLSSAQLREGFPMFDAPDGTEAYFEPEAGFVRPEPVITAQLMLARRAGAELRLGESVLSWAASSGAVTVTTDTATLEAQELVLCAGPWITKLVPDSAGLFAVYPQIVHWFGIRGGYEALRRMPIFIWEMAGVRDAFTHLSGGFYGFPAIDGPDGGIKLATERYDATADPDQRADTDIDLAASARTLYERYLARYFPWVTAAPLRITSCFYTSTRASRFIIDQLPGHPNVRIVAACSGHGFKHSAAIGEAVAQTISDGVSELDLTAFALAGGFVDEAAEI
jgi:sarcosine oxidase